MFSIETLVEQKRKIDSLFWKTFNESCTYPTPVACFLSSAHHLDYASEGEKLSEGC